MCFEGLFGIIRVLTCLVGPFTICYHWFGGSDRNGWTDSPSEKISLGYCRSRQPKALGLQQAQECPLEVRLESHA